MPDILIRIVWRDFLCTAPEADPVVTTDLRRRCAPFVAKDDRALLALALDEEERFVLTFVDGWSAADSIAERSGLAIERVRAVLERLVALGAVGVPAVETAEAAIRRFGA
jgi:hypothetical protein